MTCNVVKQLEKFLIPIESLNFDTKNARHHNERNLTAIRASLSRFGQRTPLVVQKDGMVVRAGNGRLEAARGLGWTHIAAVIVDESDIDAAAYSLTDNKTSDLGTWNDDILSELMSELQYDLDLGDLGWDSEEINAIISEPLEEHPSLAQEGSERNPSSDNPKVDIDTPVNLTSDAPRTNPGDILILGSHRVFCGNALEPANWDRLIGTKVADMCFTDPPYNLDFGGDIGGRHPNPKFKERTIIGDKQTDKEWRLFTLKLSEFLKRKVSGDCYIWVSHKSASSKMLLWLEETGFHHSTTVMWAKDHFVITPANYQRKYEPCLYGWYGCKSSWNSDRKQTDVWEFPKPTTSKEHPHMKPISLCTKGIANSSKRGDLVLDPFLGSGSTLLACEQIERTCFGFEIDPGYCDVILKRWENLTNQRAERVKSD